MAGVADNNFLRAWLAVAFSCFLAPTTSLNISPRCFPTMMHLDAITETNVCQFVVDQLKLAFARPSDKKAVCCCVMHLVVSAILFFPLCVVSSCYINFHACFFAFQIHFFILSFNFILSFACCSCYTWTHWMWTNRSEARFQECRFGILILFPRSLRRTKRAGGSLASCR